MANLSIRKCNAALVIKQFVKISQLWPETKIGIKQSLSFFHIHLTFLRKGDVEARCGKWICSAAKTSLKKVANSDFSHL